MGGEKEKRMKEEEERGQRLILPLSQFTQGSLLWYHFLLTVIGVAVYDEVK
jgi:hypothetical protein